MKPPDFKRDIRLQSSRKFGEAPAIGKIAKVREVNPSFGNPDATWVSGAHDDVVKRSPALQRLILLWSIVLGSIAFAVIAAAVFFWLIPNVQSRRAVALNTAAVPEYKVRVASRFPSPSEDEAIRLVKRAITNRDPAKLAAVCRLGAVSEEEAVGFFTNFESQGGEIARYNWLGSINADPVLLEGVQVVFKDTSKRLDRIAFLTPDDSGVWKLDFESFARTVKPAWKEILNNGPEGSVVRVAIGRDSYFNGLYNESEWICYALGSPDIDELLRGYCKVGSPEAEAINALLAEGGTVRRVTLEIRRAKGAEAKQFEITRFLAKEWVVADAAVSTGGPGPAPLGK